MKTNTKILELAFLAIGIFVLTNCAGAPEISKTEAELSNTTSDDGTVLTAPGGQPAQTSQDSSGGSVDFDNPNNDPNPHTNPDIPIVNVTIPNAGPNGENVNVPGECVSRYNGHSYCSIRIQLCHNGHTIEISLNAARAHLRNHREDRVCACDYGD